MNILFVFSDQQRWDTVGCYGGPDITPNLDRLAREGVRFSHTFTCQPVCGPARACLQTGRFATETGCFRNGIALPLGETTLARCLSAAGYDVGYVGKWHLASTMSWDCPDIGPDVDHQATAVPPEYRGGYDDFWLASDVLEFTSHGYGGHMFNGDMERVDFPEGRYRVDAMTDQVLDYLGSRRGDRPFFLFVSFLEPHHQNDHNHYEGPTGSRERFDDFTPPGDVVDAGGDWREEYPDYLGCVASLDENVGRMVAALEEMGELDNTLIIYTSDHACHFRTRADEYKRTCHESSLRIPCIIRGPGFRGGVTRDELVSLIDLPPTVVTAGGVTPPDAMQGRPLQQLADGSAVDWQDDVFAQISENSVARAVRTRRWKYCVTAPDAHPSCDAGAAEYRESHLYDLAYDPHEQNNLVADPARADVRADMAERLRRRMRQAHEDIPEILPATH